MISIGEITEDERNYTPPRKRFDPDGSKQELFLATSNCPSFEHFLSEHIGDSIMGGVVEGCSVCHWFEFGIDVDIPSNWVRWLPCAGKMCNCPVELDRWISRSDEWGTE